MEVGERVQVDSAIVYEFRNIEEAGFGMLYATEFVAQILQRLLWNDFC